MPPCACYVVCFNEGFISFLTNGVGRLEVCTDEYRFH